MRTKDIRRKWLAATGAAILCIAASPVLAAGKAKAPTAYCASDADLAALNARVLQTELMVAALTCDQRQRYNTFITTYQDQLTVRGRALQAMFRRVHGPQGETRMNAFITKLANDSSQQVREKGDEYCVFAAELFDETTAASPSEINRLASKPWIESRHGYRPCVLEASRKQTG